MLGVWKPFDIFMRLMIFSNQKFHLGYKYPLKLYAWSMKTLWQIVMDMQCWLWDLKKKLHTGGSSDTHTFSLVPDCTGVAMMRMSYSLLPVLSSSPGFASALSYCTSYEMVPPSLFTWKTWVTLPLMSLACEALRSFSAMFLLPPWTAHNPGSTPAMDTAPAKQRQAYHF